ncbi:hypothetical protein HPB51_016116 [Rhipicephalus microplus]|uniref:EB domain-containing protein n=1 Tax=Rhipicephalus microplus TaxID=6941 RepID=A0A9J6DW57_RHIMP|nr:hypothetical protein HPB51_016116 [Rhipicephalus microplus]
MQFLISELLTTAAYLLRPEQTNGAFGDVVSPYAYDAATVDIPVSPMTRENTTAKVTTDGQDIAPRGVGLPCAHDSDCIATRGLTCQEWLCACAPVTPVRVEVQGVGTCLSVKALYESCRFHQECSHLNANMRCVDSLCYCPAPFVLRRNGQCLEPREEDGTAANVVVSFSRHFIPRLKRSRGRCPRPNRQVVNVDGPSVSSGFLAGDTGNGAADEGGYAGTLLEGAGEGRNEETLLSIASTNDKAKNGQGPRTHTGRFGAVDCRAHSDTDA